MSEVAGCQGSSCSCSREQPNYPWIIGKILTPVGYVSRVATKMTRADKVGTWKARWKINRMNYSIPPGLYCVGQPDENSPVLVTANYKMSFDKLRAELQQINAWIVVLDTRGINVWCAAGKGTFGTAEIVNRIELVRLSQVVAHRTIILPQLGAPGVAAHEVRKQSGFKVVYGPTQAKDLPAFLAAGMKATKAMRSMKFGFLDRVTLIPVELTAAMKPLLITAAILLIVMLSGLGKVGYRDIYALIGTVLMGTVLTPALLPWIPGRAFAFKGWIMGLLWAGVLVYLGGGITGGWIIPVAYLLLLPAISAFLAMNFTGASTYTSLSGVQKEIKFAMPLIIGLSTIGVILWGLGQFV